MILAGILTLLLMLVLVLLAMCALLDSKQCELKMVSRKEWGARDPKKSEPMANPVGTVVIHHTYRPTVCHTLKECKAAVRSIQNFHMDERGWNDIGYSFLIGLDSVFEGRGWSKVGAHSPPYNNRSIGISFIGDYTEDLPAESLLCQGQQLISYGVTFGYIRPDYQLIGHRQARDTLCPGDRFYDLIKTWSHWTPTPVVI